MSRCESFWIHPTLISSYFEFVELLGCCTLMFSSNFWGFHPLFLKYSFCSPTAHLGLLLYVCWYTWWCLTGISICSFSPPPFYFSLWASLIAQLVKNSLAMHDTWVWSLGWEDTAGEGNSYPLQYSGLENSMDSVVHRVTKSQTRLSDFHFHFYFSQTV